MENQQAQPSPKKKYIGLFLLTGVLIVFLLTRGMVSTQKQNMQAAPNVISPEESKPSVVYIHIDRVAQELGLIDQATKQLQSANEGLIKTREEARAKLQQQVTEAENKLGEKATEEQQQELVNLLQQARARLNQVDKQLAQIANQNKLTLVKTVRNQIFPYARDIATELGASSLQELEVTVFWHDEKLDISNRVIERMRAEAKVQSTKETDPSPIDAEAPQSAPSK